MEQTKYVLVGRPMKTALAHKIAHDILFNMEGESFIEQAEKALKERDREVAEDAIWSGSTFKPRIRFTGGLQNALEVLGFLEGNSPLINTIERTEEKKKITPVDATYLDWCIPVKTTEGIVNAYKGATIIKRDENDFIVVNTSTLAILNRM